MPPSNDFLVEPPSKRSFGRWFLPAALASVAGLVFAADFFEAVPSDERATFVGRQKCVVCHEQQATAYAGSDHDLAMDVASAETIVDGQFDDQKYTHPKSGIVSRMFREGGKYLVETEGPDGKPGRFEVKYVFGVHPLQQYMVEFVDGRVQVLSTAWDTNKKQWFDLHPEERIPHGDWLHWTKGGQNWNYMCADCHSTNLQKNFDLASNTYHTTWSEIDVSCEACHGPGSIHVAIKSSPSIIFNRIRHGTGLAELKNEAWSDGFWDKKKAQTAARKNELETCARCHARRLIAHADDFGQHDFLDCYDLTLLDGPEYHPDGQILDELYEYGSFLQSRMYREGVRCSDCHDPHSSRLKATGNQLCNRCHTQAKYDTTSHHHHKLGAAGAECVACHMPSKTYMEVDPRRDHSIRVPRPDLTLKIGTPNACQACHQAELAKDPAWAANHVEKWYGPKPQREPHYGEAIFAARAGRPEALPDLTRLAATPRAGDPANDPGPLVRASAVALLAQFAHADAYAAIRLALRDAEPLVRAAAVRAVDPGRSVDPGEMTAQLIGLLAPLLDDPIRLVRTEAARVLACVPAGDRKPEQLPRFAAVLEEWRAGRQATIDDAGSHLALGSVAFNLNDLATARRELSQAMSMRGLPLQAVQARMQMALLEHMQQRDADAERLYREAIAVLQGELDTVERERAEAVGERHAGLTRARDYERRVLGGAYFNLGLLMVEAQPEPRYAEAAEALSQAATHDRENAQIHYNYGLVLQRLGKLGDAEQSLSRAVQLAPRMPEYLLALLLIEAKRGSWATARQHARDLVNLDGRYQHVLVEIEQRARAAGQ